MRSQQHPPEPPPRRPPSLPFPSDIVEADQSDRLVDLIRRLAVDDPWQRSREGLDDCCLFCGSWETEGVLGKPYDRLYGHEANCAWAEARVAVGAGLPANHYVLNGGDEL